MVSSGCSLAYRGLLQVPGMNGPNTRGLLGKRLSAPVTQAVFGPFMPGTCTIDFETLWREGGRGWGTACASMVWLAARITTPSARSYDMPLVFNAPAAWRAERVRVSSP